MTKMSGNGARLLAGLVILVTIIVLSVVVGGLFVFGVWLVKEEIWGITVVYVLVVGLALSYFLGCLYDA